MLLDVAYKTYYIHLIIVQDVINVQVRKILKIWVILNPNSV